MSLLIKSKTFKKLFPNVGIISYDNITGDVFVDKKNIKNIEEFKNIDIQKEFLKTKTELININNENISE